MSLRHGRFNRWAATAGAGGLALLLAGCGGNMQPAIVTFIPTQTTTEAPVIVMSTAAVVTSLPQATSTPVPTRPPVSPTAGPSPTMLLAPTRSPAPATQAATRVPTMLGLSVEYFTTDSVSVRPGDNVTLFWSVRGVSYAQIYRVDEDGERIWRWDVNANGKLTVGTRAADRDVARFLLEAESGGTVINQPLLIPLQCPELWFFDPQPEACPAAPPQLSAQAEQTFERGRMIWVGAQDRVYVIFEDGNSPTWAQYPDNFNEGDQERDDTLSPPPGLDQPIRGFGLVWRSTPRVQERLGWAVSPEVPFDGMFQSDSAEPSIATLYLRMRDGGIVALDSLNDEWEIIPFTAPETTAP